jgi:hypothetical protein
MDFREEFEKKLLEKFDKWGENGEKDGVIDKEEVLAELGVTYVVGKGAKAAGEVVTENLENIDELGDVAGWIGSAVKRVVKFIGNSLF